MELIKLVFSHKVEAERISRGNDLCFHCMFNTNFSGNKNVGFLPPVATDLSATMFFKVNLGNVDIETFYQCVGPTSKTMSMFASTCVCEQLFSSPISIDGCASPLNVKICDCTIFGTRY